MIGARLQEGPFHKVMALSLALAKENIFEKILLPVGTAGFEPATP
jgi:hypothetical protein